jgi:hypothetical protein
LNDTDSGSSSCSDNLDSARPHPGERGADFITGGEPEPEAQEGLRNAGVLH